MTILIRIKDEFAAEARAGNFSTDVAEAFAKHQVTPQPVHGNNPISGLFYVAGLDAAQEAALVTALNPETHPTVLRAYVPGARRTVVKGQSHA